MKKKLCILLGSAHVGGGTFVIFQHALWLAQHGYAVTIVPHFPIGPTTLDWHPEAKAQLVFKTFEQVANESFDLTLATWWRTAFDLHRIKSEKYGYFVQSIESRFFRPEDASHRLLAEASYMFRLPSITEVSWIVNYLNDHFDTKAQLVLNGVRKDLFKVDGPQVAPRLKKGIRVLVEGPLSVFFKNTERTVELCSLSRADEIWFLTSTPKLATYPGVNRVFSCVPITQTPEIYRSTDIIVKLSYVEGMFGPPLEQFHCGGTAIVYKVTGGEEYLRNNENSIVLEKDNEEGVIQTINSLRDSPKKLSALKEQAIITAQNWPSWDQSSAKFQLAIEALLTEPSPTRQSLKEMSEFFMNTYNAMQSAAHKAPPSALVSEDELNRLRKLEGMLGSILESKTMKLASKLRDSPKLHGASRAVMSVAKRLKGAIR